MPFPDARDAVLAASKPTKEPRHEPPAHRRARPPSYRGQHYAHPEELRSAQMRPHELQRAELNARVRRVGVKEWHAHTARYWHRVDPVVVDRKMLAGDVYKLSGALRTRHSSSQCKVDSLLECGRWKVDWLCGSRSQLGCVRRGVGRSPSARLQTESFPTFDLEITTRSG